MELLVYRKISWVLLPSILLWVCSTSNNANGMQQTSDIFSGIAWYYGDNDFIIQTFDFIARSDAAPVTCSTWYGFSRDL